MDHIDGSAHSFPVMSALPADPDLMGDIMANSKAQDLDISAEDIGSAEFHMLCRQFVKSREKRKAEKSIEKDPRADVVVPKPEAVLAPEQGQRVALPSKVTKRHKEKRRGDPDLGSIPWLLSDQCIIN